MSFIAPLPTKERLKQSSRAKKSKGKKEKVARGVKQNRFVKAKYNRELQKITNELLIQTKSELVESLRRLEPEYIQDNYAEVLGNILFTLTNRWRNITRHAKLISAEMVNGINDKNRKMFYKSLQNATGVNLNGIISEEGLQPMLTSSINENVSLIQSIPDEYFKKLNTIINEGTKRGKSSGGIIKDILSLLFARIRALGRAPARSGSVSSIESPPIQLRRYNAAPRRAAARRRPLQIPETNYDGQLRRSFNA